MPNLSPKRWIEDAERIDVALYTAIAETPSPSLDVAMSRLASAADYSRLSIAAAALLAATGGSSGRRAAALGLGSVAVTATVVNALLKPVGRRRPDRVRAKVPEVRHVPMPRSSSLPSGHTAAAFAFATGVGDVMPYAAGPLRALAAGVGYSRVHTGVHYPGDVVAGALVGSVLAQVTTSALERRGRITRSG